MIDAANEGMQGEKSFAEQRQGKRAVYSHTRCILSLLFPLTLARVACVFRFHGISSKITMRLGYGNTVRDLQQSDREGTPNHVRSFS